MPRTLIRAAVVTVLASAAAISSASAQDQALPINQPPVPVLGGPQALPPTYLQQPGYVYLNAPLYPSPQPFVPQEVGSTVITNQAFSPHEMLYSHRYHAMYPPFYYKVNGRWVVTRDGLLNRESWKLQGTEVKVKYHSHISPLALFCPPYNIWWKNRPRELHH
jgi:hypothetical protein